MAATAPDLSSLFPGFEALQGLARGAGSALPGLGSWVTPTIDPDELGKRIEELKTVQFWLDQNSRMITTTIQAMEVQRMTLTTLRTMNVQVQDLAEAFKIRVPEDTAADPTPSSASEPGPRPGPQPKAPREKDEKGPAKAAASQAKAAGEDPPVPGLVDPMQWWGALAQQFTQIAAQTLKDSSAGSGIANTAGAASPAPASAAGGPSQPGPSGSSRSARSSPTGRSNRSSKEAESTAATPSGGPTGRRPRAR